jgi:hypothetical protein
MRVIVESGEQGFLDFLGETGFLFSFCAPLCFYLWGPLGKEKGVGGFLTLRVSSNGHLP